MKNLKFPTIKCKVCERFLVKITNKKCIICDYHIDNSVLSNVPSVLNLNDSHCEINSVISLSDFHPPKRHNLDINLPITEFEIHVAKILINYE